MSKSTYRYESAKQRARTQQQFQKEQTRLNGKINARGMAPKRPERFGVLADRAYGSGGRCKQGVHHFSV
jgi:hypothetical protein